MSTIEVPINETTRLVELLADLLKAGLVFNAKTTRMSWVIEIVGY